MNEREVMLNEFKRIRLASTVGALTIDGYRNALAQCREVAEAAISRLLWYCPNSGASVLS